LKSNIKNSLKVSIITVVFNGEKYLEQTIRSVINQTYNNIEYIIIDGGSTDKTIDIVNKYKEHVSYFVSEPDDGLYDAMNKGIVVATGEIIGIVNSDDWYELNAVEYMVNAYKKNPEKRIFHGDVMHIFSDEYKKLRKFNPSEFRFKYYAVTYEHPTFFVVDAEYKEHLYNTKLKVLSDYQFMLEAFLKNKNKFYYLPQTISNFRIGGESAKISLLSRLREGFIARKNAGMKLYQNIFSYVVRFMMISLYSVVQSTKKLLRP